MCMDNLLHTICIFFYEQGTQDLHVISDSHNVPFRKALGTTHGVHAGILYHTSICTVCKYTEVNVDTSIADMARSHLAIPLGQPLGPMHAGRATQ